MTNQSELLPAADIAHLIHLVREQRAILDNDLAAIYGVATKALNQAVKRNLSRFPADFLLRLTPTESEALMRSQIVTASPGATATDLSKRNIRHPPYAFTEHGALMAATILNSPRAVAMSVYVIRAFVKMRAELTANAAILKRLAEMDKTLLIHDVALRDILEKLRPLLAPPPPLPRPEIGFHVKEDALPYRARKKTKARAGLHPS